MTAYYNEFDPKAAAWLRELIADGLIAHGEVDERSIIDVSASDLKGYTQHHFFAGIGGWSYALRLAQWPDDHPVWTASLPCQPFSAAGKGLGKQDERHLLPHFISLVAQCRPTVLFGEQVSAAIKHGWLDDLYAEMEANNYACGSVVIGAHSIGAAHIRQRLYWVADSPCQQREQQSNERSSSIFGCGRLHDSESERWAVCDSQDIGSTDGEVDSLADSGSGVNEQSSFMQTAGTVGMAYSASKGFEGGARESVQNGVVGSAGGCGVNGMANSVSEQREHQQNKRSSRLLGTSIQSEECVSGSSNICATSNIDWIYCRDNKYRPVKSGIKPLVDGVPRGMVHSSDPRNTQEARAVRLKGYGNAIVPTLAAEFIKAYMQCKS